MKTLFEKIGFAFYLIVNLFNVPNIEPGDVVHYGKYIDKNLICEKVYFDFIGGEWIIQVHDSDVIGIRWTVESRYRMHHNIQQSNDKKVRTFITVFLIIMLLMSFFLQ